MYLLAVNINAICHFAVYLLFPTYIFRDVNVFRGEGFYFLSQFQYTVDSVFNAFPSLHVSSAIICYIFSGFMKRFSHAGSFFCVVVVFSTLGSLQHCVTDVVGGLGMGLLTLLSIEAFLGNLESRG